MDEIGKREFAAKKAKLAAAELAKLSRRVCGKKTFQFLFFYSFHKFSFVRCREHKVEINLINNGI